ncbi:TDP-fucosamine acetyltransferase [Anatilimnocola aggregata]|uniref:TDP-fucosamine acetyltransferase n=1 Tax=Anatilimnocola aggregata TaxID=2528021 RepID=A0A517Y5X8_9BACT|nr:GNAT family N-acetyltransferase [Anatilimnocola aggregata]QDU25620.1 TDP-fucosamine acetyltransferase [Anatilimnocola aggregata]
MNLQLREQLPNFIAQYGSIPIAFEVNEHLAVELFADGLGGIRLIRRDVDAPYKKDYDSLPGQSPDGWAKQWDLTKWCLCAAFSDEAHVGSVAIIIDTTQVYGRLRDNAEAVLWDIRVRPDYQRRGVGRQLLAFAERRARSAGKQRLSVETQNNNVPACRFYAAAGFELRCVDRFAYPLLPNEVQLIWSKQLRDATDAGR